MVSSAEAGTCGTQNQAFRAAGEPTPAWSTCSSETMIGSELAKQKFGTETKRGPWFVRLGTPWRQRSRLGIGRLLVTEGDGRAFDFQATRLAVRASRPSDRAARRLFLLRAVRSQHPVRTGMKPARKVGSGRYRDPSPCLA